MEDDNTQNMPIICANGCGFYGGAFGSNLCSRCFKELKGKDGAPPADSITAPTPDSSATADPSVDMSTPAVTATPESTTPVLLPELSSVSPELATPELATPELTTPELATPELATPTVSTPTIPTPTQDSGVSTPTPMDVDAPESLAPESPAPVVLRSQPNKGRCFVEKCTSKKIPLAKQMINKCKCEFVFCDLHKNADDHKCSFDYERSGKELLEKNNPKLNDKPRGGRSFTRISDD